LKNSATEVDLYNAWEVRVHCKRFSFKWNCIVTHPFYM
jgi:hypothetical protein